MWTCRGGRTIIIIIITTNNNNPTVGAGGSALVPWTNPSWCCRQTAAVGYAAAEEARG